MLLPLYQVFLLIIFASSFSETSFINFRLKINEYCCLNINKFIPAVMLSTIASFIWGPKTAPSLSESEVTHNSIKDDVLIDVIANDIPAIEDIPASGTFLSTSSLSDEEAEWVFVNNKQG